MKKRFKRFKRFREPGGSEIITMDVLALDKDLKHRKKRR